MLAYAVCNADGLHDTNVPADIEFLSTSKKKFTSAATQKLQVKLYKTTVHCYFFRD